MNIIRLVALNKLFLSEVYVNVLLIKHFSDYKFIYIYKKISKVVIA